MKIDCFLIYLTRSLVVININSLELNIWVAVVATESVNSMFIWNHFPKLHGKIEKKINRTTATVTTAPKKLWFNKGNKNFRRVHHAFFPYFFAVTVRIRHEITFFRVLCRTKTSNDRIFFLFLNLDKVLICVLGSQLQGVWLHLNLTVSWNNRGTI